MPRERKLTKGQETRALKLLRRVERHMGWNVPEGEPLHGLQGTPRMMVHQIRALLAEVDAARSLEPRT